MYASSSVVLQFPVRNIKSIAKKNALVRLKNADYRSREYLTEPEVDQLIAAAKRVGRHGHRDATLILLSYRHGLRVSELVNLRWDQVDLHQGLIHINRLKRGTSSVHPLRGTEVVALNRLNADYPKLHYVFCSERKTPLSADAFRKIIFRAGQVANLPFSIHPHMMRHACGYKLAQAGQDTRAIQHYLGHRNIQHTVRYTQLSAERFKNFWQD
ncbi:MAG: integrase [Gallionellales bacterium 35-53-114]|jgi:type 1 fimbriae regulatory protein FimB/type 1 fimbriae regulatory protein FimE|nr:MAG: integrase [Gallionellales bacterium 35-53-114]OYZ64956.1 MAG: integrase [Gallionellales bacterium 24-53-125]OZB07506.1 MAG: integrase [Gallionellales bacterium 39-52-133]HQS58824.1 tyrosine-type recombinase/integrase [Gallionellaceae bacterium]HQS75165.1 tyrosine-type recombinase/integrase [Gallionellaceae bacterium]